MNPLKQVFAERYDMTWVTDKFAFFADDSLLHGMSTSCWLTIFGSIYPENESEEMISRIRVAVEGTLK